MSPRKPRLGFREGVLTVDGKGRLLIAGDYPYYRDRPELWAPKLKRMREAGIEVVTFYIPWRHHLARGGEFVFSGEDNRNVLGFIDRIAGAGLLAIAKPGPFVHAEIQLGGLPDRLSPTNAPSIAGVLAADEKPLSCMDSALPSGADPVFSKEAQAWLTAVADQVLKKNLHPRGPVVAVQLGNEGLYSDVSMGIDAYDYAEPALRRFRDFLAGKYRTIECLNNRHGTSWRAFEDVPAVRTWKDAPLTALQDWGEWSERYLAGVFGAWSKSLGEVPKVVNIPPPALTASAGLDAWLSRVRPERFDGIQYGFTSWAGNVMRDEKAFLSYVLAAKRRRGPNLEENWGFLWSDPACADPVTPAYHALLALAAGATGFNVYTACATDAWGPTIAADNGFLSRASNPHAYAAPYASEAPIGARGEPGRKFETLQLLTHFLGREGTALTGCAPRKDAAWAVYAPNSAVAAWNPPASERRSGLRLPLPSSEGLARFAESCIDRGAAFGLVDLESASDAALAAWPRIVLSGSFFMSADVQEKLARYVEGGGTLGLFWEAPACDENLAACGILKDRILGHSLIGGEAAHSIAPTSTLGLCRPLRLPKGAVALLASPAGAHGYAAKRGKGRVVYLDLNAGFSRDAMDALLNSLGLPEAVQAQAPFIAEYENDERDTAFVFALSRADEEQVVTREVRGRKLEVRLTGRGCAVVEVSRGELAGCFVKGVNEASGRGAPIFVRYGEREISTDIACDLSAVPTENGFEVKTSGLGATRPKVALPGRLCHAV